MNEVTIAKILTKDELKQALFLYKKLRNTGKFAKTLRDDIIRPNIERINKNIGQENDPLYLAYAVEWVFMKEGK